MSYIQSRIVLVHPEKQTERQHKDVQKSQWPLPF